MEAESKSGIPELVEDLVKDKEAAERRLLLIESVLSRNNIYILVIDREERIVFHNIPDANDMSQLSDCEYILGEGNLTRVRSLINTEGISGAGMFDITLRNKVLDITLFTIEEIPDLVFLQFAMINQQRGASESHKGSEVDIPSIGLGNLQETMVLLDEIRNLSSNENQVDMNLDQLTSYIAKVDRLMVTNDDPILSLCFDIIKKNLEELGSPTKQLSDLYKVLTPSEIQVAEFIRMGKTSKDIADALDIAQKTVENHRNKVRDKLGLKNKSVNLRSYLMQLGKNVME